MKTFTYTEPRFGFTYRVFYNHDGFIGAEVSRTGNFYFTESVTDPRELPQAVRETILRQIEQLNAA